MPDREKVKTGIFEMLQRNTWKDIDKERHRFQPVLNDALVLLKEQDEEHRRLLSWLGKFCRHIDNGDKWLTDEENLAFFREKMEQQFGWFAD